MKRIPLTKGKFALISDNKFEDISQFKWYAMWSAHMNDFYAARYLPRRPGKTRPTELMHRRILGLKYGDRRKTDHINHLTLDNQDENIRIVTTRENAENLRNQSRYGVGIQKSLRHKSRPFRVYAKINGKSNHIGMFATAAEAQIARKKWLEIHDQ